MYYEPFSSLFPEIATKERTIIYLPENKGISKGEYIFFETYCNDKKCDCRRTIVSVYFNNPETFTEKPLANISFGWEDLKFYRKLLKGLDDKRVLQFKNPMLDLMYVQSVHAPVLLEAFVNLVETDLDYVKRLERNYVYYKDKKGMHLPFRLRRIMRSLDACPCDSGKIFKLCCGKTRSRLRKGKRR